MKATKAVSVLLLASICWDDHGTAGVDAESTTTASSGTQSQKTTPSHYNGFPLKTRVVVDRNYTNPSWTGYGWATLAKHSCQHTAVVGGPTYSSSDAAEAACEKTDGCMAVENPYCLLSTAPMVPVYVLCLSPRFEENPGSCLRVNRNAQRLYFYDRTAANCGSQNSAYILDRGECEHAFSLLSDQSNRPAKQTAAGLVCKDDADSSCGKKVQQSGCFYTEDNFRTELTEAEMGAAFADRGLWFKPTWDATTDAPVPYTSPSECLAECIATHLQTSPDCIAECHTVSAKVKSYTTARGSGSLCRFRPMEDTEEFTSTSIAVTSTSSTASTTTTTTDLGGIHPHHPKPRPYNTQTNTTTTTTTHRRTDTTATTKTATTKTATTMATTMATTNTMTTTTITTTTITTTPKTKTQTTTITRTTQTTTTATKATTNPYPKPFWTTSTTARATTVGSSSSSSSSRTRARTSSTAIYTSRTTASTTATTPASYKTEAEIKDMYELAVILITLAGLVIGLVYIGKRKLRWFKPNKQKEKRRRSKKRRRRGDGAVNMTNVFTFESDSGSDIGLLGLSNGDDDSDEEYEDGYYYKPSMMNVPLTASSSLSSILIRSNIGAPIDEAMLEFTPALPPLSSTIRNKRKDTNESHL